MGAKISRFFFSSPDPSFSHSVPSFISVFFWMFLFFVFLEGSNIKTLIWAKVGLAKVGHPNFGQSRSHFFMGKVGHSRPLLHKKWLLSERPVPRWPVLFGLVCLAQSRPNRVKNKKIKNARKQWKTKEIKTQESKLRQTQVKTNETNDSGGGTNIIVRVCL